jgi:hypothetical protein
VGGIKNDGRGDNGVWLVFMQCAYEACFSVYLFVFFWRSNPKRAIHLIVARNYCFCRVLHCLFEKIIKKCMFS